MEFKRALDVGLREPANRNAQVHRVAVDIAFILRAFSAHCFKSCHFTGSLIGLLNRGSVDS